MIKEIRDWKVLKEKKMHASNEMHVQIQNWLHLICQNAGL